MERDSRYELDNLTKYDKPDLVGKTFVVDHITDGYLGDNGFFKLVFLKVGSEEVNGFMFISVNSALDRPNVVNVPVTLVTVTSKNGYDYYKYTDPKLIIKDSKLTDFKTSNTQPKKSKPKGKKSK